MTDPYPFSTTITQAEIDALIALYGTGWRP